MEGRRLSGVVFGIVGGPSDRGDWMFICAAGMYADRQLVACGSCINWPIETPSQGVLVHHQHQDRYKALVVGPTFDLGYREVDILGWDHDRCSETRILV